MRYLNKKGQGALEFLTTYGWAFLVVIVMIGAMSSFGVFGNVGVDKCISGQGFKCEGTVVAEQNQKFKFKNTLGEEVSISNASATVRSTGEVIDCDVPSGAVDDGSSFEVSCQGSDLSSGKRENLDVQFSYYSATSSNTYAKTAQVVVAQKVIKNDELTDVFSQTDDFLNIIANYDGYLHCPEGFAYIPGNSYFGTTDFCVMKFEAKKVNNVPTSVEEGLPWVSISLSGAKSECEQEGYRLISNIEWMTVARNMEQIFYNWDSGNVGVGSLYLGNVDSGSLKSSSSNLNGINRRTMYLSNGAEIWDMSGNAKEWVDIFGDGSSLNSGNICGTSGWYGYVEDQSAYACVWDLGFSKSNSVDKRLELGPVGNYDANNGVGRIYSTTLYNVVLLRGGHYINGLDAGIFSADVGGRGYWSAGSWGFRCTANTI